MVLSVLPIESKCNANPADLMEPFGYMTAAVGRNMHDNPMIPASCTTE